MSASPGKRFLTTTLITGVMLFGANFVYAQNDSTTPRGASFLPGGGAPAPSDYSGLATIPPVISVPVLAVPVSSAVPVPDAPPIAAVPAVIVPTPAPVVAVSAPVAPASIATAPILSPPAASVPSASVPVGTTTVTAAPILVSAVTTAPTATDALAKPVPAPLPVVSAETVSVKNSETLGADVWKGTPRATADILLANAAPTQSALLNNLMRRLLLTAATPPEGDSAATQSLTSMRIAKLIAFGDGNNAWTLSQSADAKLVDDDTFRLAAENALMGDSNVCAAADNFTKARGGVDWQKLQITCQLRTKDSKSAQVALDVMRTQSVRDTVFLEIADRDILADGKKLPSQLTPLTPPAVGLMQIANLNLPSELYTRPDASVMAALLRLPAQQDVAKLALAEKAATRGIISDKEVGAVYHAVNFMPDVLKDPLSSNETGLRLHALLYRASENEQDAGKRISYAVRFAQSASPVFLNNAGGVAAMILGNAKPENAHITDAVDVAAIYMMASRADSASEWYKLAQSDARNAEPLVALWPQFMLAGVASENDFGKWLAFATKDDNHDTRDAAASVLLLMDAAGFPVPDTAWAKVMESPVVERKISVSPVLLDRLQVAGANGRRAESILLAVDMAGNDVISVPKSVAIIRALRFAGLKAEASMFARQAIGMLGVKN